MTSSAKGSCKRRAIETAPRMETSNSGSSAAANSLAEYTEAPASLTLTRVSLRSGFAVIISATTASVSRLAVPLPIAIKSTLYSRHKRANSAIEPSLSSLGANV